MSTQITITIEDASFTAELNDCAAARSLAESLPREVRMSRWGDEYYGSVGLALGNDADARDVLDVGEIAYWPPGDALCVFFGPTPASEGTEPRAASAVTVLGRITSENVDHLKEFGSSVKATLAPG